MRSAPPALPVLVRPCATDRAEYIAAQNPRTDVVEAACLKMITFLVPPSAPCILWNVRGKDPLVHRQTTHTERMIHTLVGAGAIAVDRMEKQWRRLLVTARSFVVLEPSCYLPDSFSIRGCYRVTEKCSQGIFDSPHVTSTDSPYTANVYRTCHMSGRAGS